MLHNYEKLVDLRQKAAVVFFMLLYFILVKTRKDLRDWFRLVS